MKIGVDIDHGCVAYLSCDDYTMQRYKYTMEEMRARVSRELDVLETILLSTRWNETDRKILAYLTHLARGFSDQMAIGYIILKYTDIYEQKYQQSR
jgi:hypothetical protein